MDYKSSVSDLTAGLKPLSTGLDAFGFLKESTLEANNTELLRQRMLEDGYIYLRDLLPREDVLAARRSIISTLVEGGYVDRHDSDRAKSLVPISKNVKRGIAQNNPELQSLLYNNNLIPFFQRFFGGEVRHLDFTGLRTISPGVGTYPHCDIVYMGRGTPNLLTAWVPLGSIPLELGGLIILENSHNIQKLRETYCKRDVDTYCSNRRDADKYATNEKMWNGALSYDPPRIQRTFQRRWLTSNYEVGDVVIFSMFTVHGSLDNRTDCVRISADPRFQLSSEPIDHRYIGKNPIANSVPAKRGRVC